MSTAARSETIGSPRTHPELPAIASSRLAPVPVHDGATLEGLPLYRLSIEQYERMAEHQIIDEKSKVVLINGLLVAKMTLHPPHVIANDNLNMLLVRALPNGWYV